MPGQAVMMINGRPLVVNIDGQSTGAMPHSLLHSAMLAMLGGHGLPMRNGRPIGMMSEAEVDAYAARLFDEARSAPTQVSPILCYYWLVYGVGSLECSATVAQSNVQKCSSQYVLLRGHPPFPRRG